VSSRVRDGMDDLFDTSKPHFAAWLQVHDIDEEWLNFSSEGAPGDLGSPLYYAAFCGFYDLTERLIMKHPEQVNEGGGRIKAPLQAALCQSHFRVANLLYKHGAVVDVRGQSETTLLHSASTSPKHVDIMRWLLNHDADANARTISRRTPLHWAADYMHFEAVQVLLEHNADINSQGYEGKTPLYQALSLSRFTSPTEGEVVDVVRRLLEHGADTNIPNDSHSTPLHLASSNGELEIARLLLSYGANVDEKDEDGMTPFQVASSKEHHEVAKLLLDHGAVTQP